MHIRTIRRLLLFAISIFIVGTIYISTIVQQKIQQQQQQQLDNEGDSNSNDLNLLVKKRNRSKQRSKDFLRYNNNQTHNTNNQQQIQFIPNNQLRDRDYFSDSWLITKQRFLDLDLMLVGVVEDAALIPARFNGKPLKHAKMTVDWLDFCVEHLSKWWNDLDVYKKDSLLDVVVLQRIKNYLYHKVQPPQIIADTQTTELQQTIAMIAFAPFKGKGQIAKIGDPNKKKSQTLTMYSLAATIASLYQMGFGRVVIVGIFDNDYDFYIKPTMELLLSIFPPTSYVNNEKNKKTDTTTIIDPTNKTIQIGNNHMEITHILVTQPTWIKTWTQNYNIPRAALVGMQMAMNETLPLAEQIQWLGISKDTTSTTTTTTSSSTTNERQPNKDWKYIYLTEPDTILHTRKHLIPVLKQALDSNLSLFPHRIHLLPHEADLPTIHNGISIKDPNYVLNQGEFLPSYGRFQNITILDPSKLSPTSLTTSTYYVSCCDNGRDWPGRDGWHGCHPWWTCGFRKIDYTNGETYNVSAIEANHKRLHPYQMMRLQTGVGAVFASSNHGRQCIPSKRPCKIENKKE